MSVDLDRIVSLANSARRLAVKTQMPGGRFTLGERVEVTGEPHEPGQVGGVVKIVHAGPAYGIQFDGMPAEEEGTSMIHKWYVDDELRPEEMAAAGMGEPVNSIRNGGRARSWYRVTNLADRAEIYIYEEIGAWGVDAQIFTAELRAITAPAIDLHISSPGGAVFDGLTIYEAIRRHPAHVTSHVDGLAASAASFIAQAADRRVIAPNGVLLVHDAEGSVINGTAADFDEMGALMHEMSANVASIYAERAGGTAQEWRDRMRAGCMNLGTRYTGPQAVDVGLADEVAGATKQPTNAAPAVATATNHAPEYDFAGLQDALKGVFQ